MQVEDENGERRRISLDRLLASDDNGNGIHYRFHGWKRLPRGYRTAFLVVGIDEKAGSATIVLPEWDAEVEVGVPLAALPSVARVRGGAGSCRADLTSTSRGGLDLHGYSENGPRGLSRPAVGQHPELLAKGQEYRRHRDGKRFRILDPDTEAGSVVAWSERRRVRLDPTRLLATRPNGAGRYYAYVRGGVAATRKRRSATGASR